MFGHVACRLVVGPEVVQGRGDGWDGGVFTGGAVPLQVKLLMDMEPPPLSTRDPASAQLPPPQ